jgi:hypothetical protein
VTSTWRPVISNIILYSVYSCFQILIRIGFDLEKTFIINSSSILLEVKDSLNKRNILLLLVAVLAVGAVGIYTVYANSEDGLLDLEGCGFPAMRGWRFHNRRGMELLSEEQRGELAFEIQGLIESKMEEWGIERPEPLLTEEQRTEIRAGIAELRESEATREDIQAYITEKLAEWGIELPEMPERHQRGRGFGRMGKGPRCFMKPDPNGE